MFRMFNAKGDLIGQWENRSELETALNASHPGWKESAGDGVDENNFTIKDGTGGVVATITGPLVVDSRKPSHPQPPNE